MALGGQPGPLGDAPPHRALTGPAEPGRSQFVSPSSASLWLVPPSGRRRTRTLALKAADESAYFQLYRLLNLYRVVLGRSLPVHQRANFCGEAEKSEDLHFSSPEFLARHELPYFSCPGESEAHRRSAELSRLLGRGQRPWAGKRTVTVLQPRAALLWRAVPSVVTPGATRR